MKAWASVLVLILLFVVGANAGEVVDVNIEGTAPATTQEQDARNIILHDAVESTCEKYIQDMIGEKKFDSDKLAVNNAIRQSDKFIPYIKTDELQKTPEGFKMDVHLRVSIADLKTILTRQGLLYKNQGSPVVLPLVAFSDHIHSVFYQWWSQPEDPQVSFLATLARKFEQSLRSQLAPGEFYGIEPVSTNEEELIPSALKIENPRTEDMMNLADYLGAQVVVNGTVDLDRSQTVAGGTRAQLKLTAFHAITGRIVAEVSRTYEIDPGNFTTEVDQKVESGFGDVAKDLSSQILEAWKSGTFGAELLKLTVNGHLNFQQLQTLKSWLSENVKEIKALKERMFMPESVTYEVDSAGTSEELANHLRGAVIGHLQLQVSDVKSDQINVDVKFR